MHKMLRRTQSAFTPAVSRAQSTCAPGTAGETLVLTRRTIILGAVPTGLAACSGLPPGGLPGDGGLSPPPSQGGAGLPHDLLRPRGGPGSATPGPWEPSPAPASASPSSPQAAAQPVVPPSSQGTPVWHDVPLPGKRATSYVPGRKDGLAVVHARADGSASMWRCHARVPAAALGLLRFSWRVDALNAQASVADIEREDAVARVVLAFDGDRARLSARTRAMFDLAKSLTGEAPPFATLMYVWETAEPVGTVVVNPRTDRIRKIVVDSGPLHLGRWREHRRDIASDYLQAYGEPPGALIGVALMTDSDNTRARAEAWYGPVILEPRATALRSADRRRA